MNLTQYVLSKVAEEATELAKEALKCQQQGLFSDHRGKANHEYVRDEFIDLIARSTVLDWCSDVIEQKGDQFSLLINRYTMDREIINKVINSVNKMCYYAYMAYNNGHLQLDDRELGLIVHGYNSYLPVINGQKN